MWGFLKSVLYSLFLFLITDALVLCNVFIANLKHRSAYLHFNTALLLDANFKAAFSFFWGMFKARRDDFKSLRQWWDRGKTEIKEFCQQYVVNVSSDLAKSMRDLEIEIVEMQVTANSTGNRGWFGSLNSKKALLAGLLDSRAQGEPVHCRFQNLSLMDAPTKFFFSFEKKRGQSKSIHGLKSAVGDLLTKAESGRVLFRAFPFGVLGG